MNTKHKTYNNVHPILPGSWSPSECSVRIIGSNEAPWSESLIWFSMALTWIWPAKRPHITHHVAIIAMVSMVSWSQSSVVLHWRAKSEHKKCFPEVWCLCEFRKTMRSRKFGRVSNQESSRFKEYIVQASVSWNHHLIRPCNSIRPTQHRIFID